MYCFNQRAPPFRSTFETTIFPMQNAVNETMHGAVAVIAMNRPPVNSLGAELRTDLGAALDRAMADETVKGIVLAGTPRAFSAGADIAEFGSSKTLRDPHLHALIERIEKSPKPVVAAISGQCLGGGLELAMGCHGRVALADARLGLPDTQFGLIPGAGGTQRLPRLIGLERALNLIVSGQTLAAAEFAGTALIDLIVEGDVVEAAVAWAEQVIDNGTPLRRTRDLKVQDPQAEAFLQFARNTIAAQAKAGPAAGKAVEMIALSISKPFDQTLALEREAFSSLLRSPESRALRHVFSAERAASKIAGLIEQPTLRGIARVGVVGAGTMGGGITMNFLNAGIPVVLLETAQAPLDKGVATIRRNYENSMKKGKLRPEDVEQRMALLTPTLDYAGFADVDLAIEAVFEEMGVKQKVFEALDKVCKRGAILASNTSYLNIDRIAAFTERPADVLGLHFFSPANVMRLLEIVRGGKTATDVLATALALAKTINKVAVVSGVCDGFIGNRMISRYSVAAIQLINAGALPQQIDGALQRFGMAMGPIRMGDLAGLDIGWATTKRKYAEVGLPMPPSVPSLLCEAGRFGQKTGAGWYRYEAGRRDPIPDETTAQLIADFRASQGITPRNISDAEIVERCIYALVNEGARILEEGIAARASDIDVVYVNGYGFPRQRGGPMWYADTVGLSEVVRTLRRFAAVPGADASLQPAPLLLRLAEEGKTFN